VVDHPHLPLAAALLARWPAGHEQFKRLIDTVHPLTDTTITPVTRAVQLGASSWSEEARLGTIFVTVDNVPGLAQAMVLQMAHQKLRALGIPREGTTHLVENDPEERHDSPLGRGRKHPMLAVLHETYAFTHVACLDLHMLAAEPDPEAHEHLLMLLARNLPRVAAGVETVALHLRADADGAAFADAFLAWARAVIAWGDRALDENGYGMPVLE
jgi:HEXXH motif-containing protein